MKNLMDVLFTGPTIIGALVSYTTFKPFNRDGSRNRASSDKPAANNQWETSSRAGSAGDIAVSTVSNSSQLAQSRRRDCPSIHLRKLSMREVLINLVHIYASEDSSFMI